MDHEFAQAIESIQKRLREFSQVSDNAPDLTWEQGVDRISVDRDLFPVPYLILFVLNGLCKFPLGYRGEKTHWIVPFTFKGMDCAISHEKYGVRLYVGKASGQTISKGALLGTLRKAVEAAEKHILSKVAQEQIKSGNITIANQFQRLGNQYRYFRERAISTYSPSEPKETDDSIDGIAKSLNRHFRAAAESAYNALAMIDAYFSRLEHFLVLALPFSSFDRNTDDLTEFVGNIWSEKIKRVLNVKEQPAHGYYDRLVAVKEKYRNTFAHGGFEKKGASFYFHLPHFGAIPASMSGHKHSVHFNLFPIEEQNFNEVCTLFDQVDNWLKDSGLPSAWKYAESGLDLRFDEGYLEEMLSAANEPARFDEWLDHESYMADMYSNADY